MKKYQENRLSLRKDYKTVHEIDSWLLDNIPKVKTINHKQTSYGLKYLYERRPNHSYITNGQFIAAMLAGYPHKIFSSSPNVQFGMSERSLNP